MKVRYGSLKLTHTYSRSFSVAHLGFVQVVQLVVESSDVAEYLWRNIGSDGVCQDLTGLLVRLESTLDGNTHTHIHTYSYGLYSYHSTVAYS